MTTKTPMKPPFGTTRGAVRLRVAGLVALALCCNAGLCCSDAKPRACQDGQTLLCRCADGRIGHQTCQAGRYGLCRCDTADHDATAAADSAGEPVPADIADTPPGEPDLPPGDQLTPFDFGPERAEMSTALEADGAPAELPLQVDVAPDVAAELADNGAELLPADLPPEQVPDVVWPPLQFAPLISEIMAINDSTLSDEDGDFSDWIELYNPLSEPLDLAGYRLTDDPQNLARWAFPAVILGARQYLVVFASGKDRATAGQPLHANFRLSGDGEYLAVVHPSGVVIHAYDPYPAQLTDVSYGLPMLRRNEFPVPEGAPADYLVPTDGQLGIDWTATDFVPSGATWPNGPSGLGFETSEMPVLLRPLIATDLETVMYGQAGGLYARFLFAVDDPSRVEDLRLHVAYDDGFVAYLNGQPVANVNAPETPQWNSNATADHPEKQSSVPETFELGDALDRLQVGPNVLAFHGLNTDAYDPNFLLLPTLEARRFQVFADERRYFMAPTPGAENGTGAENPGPLVRDLTRNVLAEAAADIPVTVDVVATAAPVASVTLHYRVMFASEMAVALQDDGSGADQTAGDGTYSGVIPGGSGAAGQMIRWYVVAVDSAGAATREPLYEDPLDNEEYVGGMVRDDSVQGALPVFFWFVENPDAAGSAAGTRSALYYDGEFYDNVYAKIHGQSTQGFPKKSYNIDFPRDHRFRLRDGLGRMKDINFLTNYADKAKVRNTLAYETYRDAGAEYHIAFPFRLQLNGVFYAVYDFVEDGDDRWLQRLGLDPEGALYKMYDALVDVNTAEKKTRKDEDKADLQALIDALQQSGDPLRQFLYDNVNIPGMVDFLAAMIIMGSIDCCHKNYYAYRDTNGSGEWWYMIWDVDLSFGRVWTPDFYYFDDRIWSDRPLFVGGGSALPAALFAQPEFVEMYLRRVRTLMDELLQPPDAAPDNLRYEQRLAELLTQVGPDAETDDALWPTWGVPQTMPEGVEILRTQYLVPRREYLYGMAVDSVAVSEVLVPGQVGQAALRYSVPTDDSLGGDWILPDFDDSGWTAGTLGIGYEDAPAGYQNLLVTVVRPQTVDPAATSIFVRIPFVVDDPSAVPKLTLRVKYDDAYVAYLNGVEVAHANFAGTPTWNAQGAIHDDTLALSYENRDISEAIPWLQAGDNLLAIHVINASPGSSDMLLVVELVNGALTGEGTLPPAQHDVVLQCTALEALPASGNPAEAFLLLTNPNDFAVDISRWALTGAVQYTIRAGTVLPSLGRLYLSPNVNAFRARTNTPTGGQGLFVQGNYRGQLTGAGDVVALQDPLGNLICQW